MVVQSHHMAIAHGNTRNLTSMLHQNSFFTQRYEKK
jgi:hypothetical protein